MNNDNFSIYDIPDRKQFSMQIDVKKFEPATEEEKRQQDVMSKSTTFFRDGMRKLMKNPLAVMSIILLVIIILTIIIAPMIIPYSYSVDPFRGRKERQGRQEPCSVYLQ